MPPSRSSTVALVVRAVAARTPAGAGVVRLLDSGAGAPQCLNPAEHTVYVEAYGRAIEAGLILCAVVITGALVLALLLPDLRRRRPVADPDAAVVSQPR